MTELRALEELVALLDLEELEVNIFRGRSPQEERQRVFGGQVAGQALVAAGRTVDSGDIHSLHAYFLRPGDPQVPILYLVDRIRDGKTFTTRRVVAVQHGRAIFNMSASFQKPEPGFEHQASMPEAPDPETLPGWRERIEAYRREAPHDDNPWWNREPAMDMRFVDPMNPFRPEKRPPRQLVWMRTNGSLPDDPFLHQCITAYASDMSLIDTGLLPHGIGWDDNKVMVTSLDHAMWFHRPLRADQWLLYAQESPSAAGARALTLGHVFTQDGTLVASVTQEGLVRPIRER
jgi:acyl-CoA thioesterase-2